MHLEKKRKVKITLTFFTLDIFLIKPTVIIQLYQNPWGFPKGWEHGLVSYLYLKSLLTTPECPLNAILFFKFLGKKEIQDWPQAREGQGQTKGQS